MYRPPFLALFCSTLRPDSWDRSFGQASSFSIDAKLDRAFEDPYVVSLGCRAPRSAAMPHRPVAVTTQRRARDSSRRSDPRSPRCRSKGARDRR